jgi:hypothetical protein
MNWRSVRLELGSTREFPSGSVSRAFLLRLPLNERDEVDASALGKAPRRAVVRRHWSTDPDQNGFIVPSGDNWALGTKDSNRLLRLGGQPLRLGAMVSVVESDGTVLPFKIASIR